MNKNYFDNKLQNNALLRFGWIVISGSADMKMPKGIKTIEISSDDEASSEKNWLAYLPEKVDIKIITWTNPDTDKNVDEQLTNAGWKIIDSTESRSIYVKTKLI